MGKLLAAVVILVIAVCGPGAQMARAQDPAAFPTQPPLLPPPPPPPPPPKIDVPKVPRMGEIPSLPAVQSPQRGSFSDRVSRCVDEGAAMGLGPNERAAYSRGCANTR